MPDVGIKNKHYQLQGYENYLSHETIQCCNLLNIDPKDLLPKQLHFYFYFVSRAFESFAEEGLGPELQQIKFQHYEQKRKAKLTLVKKMIAKDITGQSPLRQRNHFQALSILAQPNESRVVKSNMKSNERINRTLDHNMRSHQQSVKPGDMSMKIESQNPLNESTSQDLDDFTSSKFESIQKMKERWMRVLENKEKLTIDKLTSMRIKIERTIKKEKEIKQRYDEDFEYKAEVLHKKGEKWQEVLKKKQKQELDFQRQLEKKDKLFQQKLQEKIAKYNQGGRFGTQDNRTQRAFLTSPGGNNKSEKDDKTLSDIKDYNSQARFQRLLSTDDNENLQSKLTRVQQKLKKAEDQKNQYLYMSSDKASQINEKLIQIQQQRDLIVEKIQYSILKKVLDKRMKETNNNQEKQKELKEIADYKKSQIQQKDEVKRAKINQIRKDQEKKRLYFEKKLIEKEKMTQNLKSAMDEYQHQKKELKNLRDDEVNSNLKEHKRVHSAYKRMLIDKLKEKDHRYKFISEKKQQVHELQLQNSSSVSKIFKENPSVAGHLDKYNEQVESRIKLMTKKKDDPNKFD